jgi:hypothetical protein
MSSVFLQALNAMAPVNRAAINKMDFFMSFESVVVLVMVKMAVDQPQENASIDRSRPAGFKRANIKGSLKWEALTGYITYPIRQKSRFWENA